MNPNFHIVFIIFQDIAYIIGGSCHFSFDPIMTHEVIAINLNTGAVTEAEDVLHAVMFAGSASSFNRIIICGGGQQPGPARSCQLYSPVSNRYVCSKLCPVFPPFKIGSIW